MFYLNHLMASYWAKTCCINTIYYSKRA